MGSEAKQKKEDTVVSAWSLLNQQARRNPRKRLRQAMVQ
jgi:hypothetical protein